MRKMITLLILITLSLPAYSPNNKVCYIAENEPIEPFKPLIYAVGKVECDFDTLAYNPKEQAAGYFQIRPIRINDYNKRTGSHYTTKDMFDYNKAEIVFLYYAHQIGPYDLERIAKRWNGSGRMTVNYWNKVKKAL